MANLRTVIGAVKWQNLPGLKWKKWAIDTVIAGLPKEFRRFM